MEGRAAGNDVLDADAHVGRRHPPVNRKIWLPKLFYDALPWFYLTAGGLALLAALYLDAWFWIIPHTLLFAAACLHLAWFVFRRRRHADAQDETGTG